VIKIDTRDVKVNYISVYIGLELVGLIDYKNLNILFDVTVTILS